METPSLGHEPPLPGHRHTARPVPALIAVSIFAASVSSGCMRPVSDGYLFPVDHVERLKTPVKVTGISEAGMNLADGRTVQLPGLTKLPTDSAWLTAATKDGVEVSSKGRVYGLMRLHHLCGNDPVRSDVRRIDLAYLLMFHGEGEPKYPQADKYKPSTCSSLSEYGWDLGEYRVFTDFVREMATAAATRPTER